LSTPDDLAVRLGFRVPARRPRSRIVTPALPDGILSRRTALTCLASTAVT
jgi:hypothetical protein